MAGAHVVTPYVVIKTVETFDDQKDPVVPGTPSAMIKPSALQQRWDTGEMTRDKQVSLGEYLRHQRAEMAPRDRDDVSPLSHRRVPGLRRQELADTAGISVDYYTRLEQGRASHPSREILNALARAFQLSEAECEHLFRLAGESPPRPRTPASQVRPGLRQLLDRMPNTIPVIIIDGRLDVLAFNDAAAELFGPAFKGRTYGRNVAFQAFTSPELSALLGNEGAAHLARVAAAELRKAMSIYPEDDRLRSLFRELSKNSSEFDRHWERGEIGTWRSAMKQVNHPTNGTLAFDSEMLHDPENDHWVMFFTPRRS